jgi:hypothetical protein
MFGNSQDLTSRLFTRYLVISALKIFNVVYVAVATMCCQVQASNALNAYQEGSFFLLSNLPSLIAKDLLFGAIIT